MRSIFYIIMISLLFACKKDDPCRGISCENGGSCINGDCKCPPQWTGSNCTEQKTPLNLLIKSVTLTKYPNYDSNGITWDIGNAPDIFIAIEVNGSIIYNGTSSRYVNATGSNLTFITNTVVQPNDLVIIRTFDFDDFDADDFMGGINGFLYGSTDGFPGVYNFGCPNCAVAYTVNLEYRH